METYNSPSPDENGNSGEEKPKIIRTDGVETEPYETLEDLQAVAGTADDEKREEALKLEAEGKPEEDDLDSDEEF